MAMRFALALWITAGPAATFAQSPTATLSGVVTDAHEGRLAGAEITLESDDRAWQQRTRTDARGAYRFPAALPGAHRVIIRLAGFATAIVSGVSLAVSQEATLDITLTIGPIEQSIVVTPPATLVEPSRSTLGRTILRDEIDELPIASRGFATFATLATLVPGVLPDITTTITGVAAAGQRGDSNAFMIDGLSMDDPLNAALRGTLPLDAIREFTVLTGNLPAEYGQSSGLVVNVVTRSGTNLPAGRGYAFLQDGRWAASPADLHLVDPLAEKPSLEHRVIGGSLSAPIRRNRAFAFLAAEQMWRETAYSYTGSAAAFQTYRAGQSTVLPVRSTFPKVVARADMRFGSAHALTVRYRFTDLSSVNVLRELKSAPERGQDLLDRVQDVAVLTMHTVGPRVVVETRSQFARRDLAFTVSRPELCPGCVAENRPGILLGKPPNAPQQRLDDRWQLAGALNWLTHNRSGDHAIKTGVDASLIRDRGDFAPDWFGTFRFAGDAAFEATRVSTYPNQYTRNAGQPTYDLGATLLSAFLQDEWKPASLVTIDAGVRLDSERVESLPARHSLAPRLGLAFDPWSRNRLSLRAGYGRYSDQIQIAVVRDAHAGATGIVINNPGYPDPSGPSLRGPSTMRQTKTELSHDLRTPYADRATAGFQWHIGARTVVAADLVGSRGRYLLIARDLNYPDLSQPGNIKPRPTPGFGQIVVVESRANSWYRGLQAGLQTTFTGATLAVAYTWSDSQNDTDGARSFPQDQRHYAANRGPSPNDSHHRLAISAMADGPWGLRAAAIVSARSGLPFSAVLPNDANGDGVFNDRRAGMGRNALRGGAFVQADLRLSKTVHTGNVRVDLVAEVFNLSNRTNWIRYDTSDTLARLGKPLESGPPRQFQFGVRGGF